MFPLKSFCVIFKLDTASCIIGWMDLGISLVGCILSCIVYSEINVMFPSDKPQFTWIIHNWRMSLGSIIGYNFLCFAMCAMLLWGIFKRKRLFLVPWIFLRGLTLLILVISILTVGGILLGTIEYESGALIYIVGLSISTFFGYCWLCIFSLYKEIIKEQITEERTAVEMETLGQKEDLLAYS